MVFDRKVLTKSGVAISRKCCFPHGDSVCNHHSKILQHHRIIIRIAHTRAHTHTTLRRSMRSVCNHHSKIRQHHRTAAHRVVIRLIFVVETRPTSDHMHRIASSVLYKKEQHRTICTSSHRIICIASDHMVRCDAVHISATCNYGICDAVVKKNLEITWY